MQWILMYWNLRGKKTYSYIVCFLLLINISFFLVTAGSFVALTLMNKAPEKVTKPIPVDVSFNNFKKKPKCNEAIWRKTNYLQLFITVQAYWLCNLLLCWSTVREMLPKCQGLGGQCSNPFRQGRKMLLRKHSNRVLFFSLKSQRGYGQSGDGSRKIRAIFVSIEWYFEYLKEDLFVFGLLFFVILALTDN